MADFDPNTDLSDLNNVSIIGSMVRNKPLKDLTGFLTARGSDARRSSLEAKQILEQGLGSISLYNMNCSSK